MSSLQEPKEDNKPKSSTLITKRSNFKLNNTSPKSNKKVNIVEDIYKSPSNSLIDNTNNDITEVSPLNQVTDSSVNNITTISLNTPTNNPSLFKKSKLQHKKTSFITNHLVDISGIENERNNDDIKYYLELREEQKRKFTKRRESIRKKRVSYESAHQVRKSVQMEITEILQMIEQSEKSTPLGRSKRILKITDVILALVITVNIIITIIDNEIYMSKADEYMESISPKKAEFKVTPSLLKQITNRKISNVENTLRFINIGIVSFAFFLVCFHYHIKLILLKSANILSKYDNIFTSGQYKYLFTELFLVSIFFPPYVNKAISGELLNVYFIYNLNAIFSIFVIAKCYLILRVYTLYSRWTSDSANSIGNKYNVKVGLHFALKAELKNRPYTMLTIATAIALAILAFAVRTFEYGIVEPENTYVNIKGDNDLQDLQNCFWLIIVTMITVGYGDMFPKSHFGRFIVIIAAIIGMLLVSLIVVSLAVLTEFTDEEKKAYNVIKKIQADSSAFQKAANVICDVCKLRYLNEKKKKEKNRSGENILGQRFIILTQLKRNISFFKNDFKIAASFTIPVDEMLKFLEFKLTGDLKELNEKLSSLSQSEESLDRIEKIQEDLSIKMDPILRRQEKIAKYIIDLNNRNYINTIAKRRQKQRNNVTNTKEYIAQKKNNKMKGTTMYPSVSFKEMSPLNNHRKKKNADILFTDHLQ